MHAASPPGAGSLARRATAVGRAAVIVLCWTTLVGPAESADYPSRPIKLVVPFGPGGGTDTFARIIERAIRESELLAEPFAIINVPGAGATIGSRRVKNAAPDGYTILILHDAILTAKYSGQAAYGPEAFEPIAGTGEVGLVIAVKEDSPYRTLADLLRAASKNRSEIAFGANIGAVTHFAGLLLEQRAPRDLGKPQFRYVQSGGGAQRFGELKGGHTDVTGFSIEEFVRFRSDGLRGLAYFGPQRHAAASDVPTARSQGVDVALTNTFYWWAPKGTPAKRIAVLAAALEQAMQTDYVRGKMREIHCRPIFLRGARLARRLAASESQIAAVKMEPVNALPYFPWLMAALTLAVLGWVAYDVRHRASALGRGVKAPTNAGSTSVHRRRYGLAAVCIVLTAAYIVALALGNVGFRTATGLFVILVGGSLSRWRPQSLPIVVATAAILAFGLHYTFTELLVIDLP